MRKFLSVAVLVLALSACTSVDSTEHCVETRYGNVVNKKMEPGLSLTVTTSATCFSMTDQNLPPMKLSVQTSDPLTVETEVSVVVAYDPATVYDVFLDKRSPDAVEVEIRNAISEGVRSAFASWSVTEIFSEQRATLGDSVLAHVQRKVGKRAIIRNAFVKEVDLPPTIEKARIAAAEQAQILDKAQKQFGIDSVNARAKVMSAEATARSNELLAQSYNSNAKLLDLEIARAWASGLSGACKGSQTCVIGASTLELLPIKR